MGLPRTNSTLAGDNTRDNKDKGHESLWLEIAIRSVAGPLLYGETTTLGKKST
jgi:hypothetical protein